jgi:inhibitor of KinA sporulation pathway (predicted exonuclease)
MIKERSTNMKAVVVDLELAQNEGTTPKIIEIGAVCVHTKSHDVLSVFSKLANPGELPCQRITDLTGISKEMIQGALSLKEVLADFWLWFENCKTGTELLSWGRGDVHLLVEASKELGVSYPEKIRCFDVKQFSSMFRQARGSKAKGGLANTLELFGINFEGKAHAAAVDSYNTAKVLFYIDQTIEFAYDTEKKFGPMKIRNENAASKQFFNKFDRKG